MSSLEDKRKREKRVVELMIRLYCRKYHGAHGTLCSQCQALADYAAARSNHCPFMKTKTFCSNCKVHCYRADMREQIRAVMRFAGPRMLLYHPGLAARHLLESRREKKRLEKDA